MRRAPLGGGNVLAEQLGDLVGLLDGDAVRGFCDLDVRRALSRLRLPMPRWSKNATR
jgi:hypothetical protein